MRKKRRYYRLFAFIRQYAMIANIRLISSVLAVSISLIAAADEYVVSSEADWASLQVRAAEGYDFSNDKILLLTDIKSSRKFDRFNGILNGNGHTITSAGLVGELLKDGEIHNLTVYFPANVRSESGSPIGGIADVCNGLIHSCTAHVKIYQIIENAHVIAGGIAGEVLENGRVAFCRNEESVTGSVVDPEYVYFSRVGGIVGWNKGLVAGCTNVGAVNGTAYSTLMLGGIVGHSDGTYARIEGCTNHGRVQGSLTRTESSAGIYGRVGGVVGYGQGCKIISECFNSGYITTNVDHIGGIVGVAANTSILNCANSGEVLNQQSYYFSCAGGICSSFTGAGIDKSLFLNCVNTGKVTSRTNPQFTATAGGVCANLYDCSFGNTLNFGAVSAEGGSKFIYDNVCQERCSALHIARTIAEANEYVSNTKPDTGMPWLLSWTGTGPSTTLACDMRQATSAYVGMIESYIDGTEAKLAAITSDGERKEVYFTDKYACIAGLKSDADYLVEWVDNAGRIIFRKALHTEPLRFNVELSEIRPTSAFVSTQCDTRGMDVVERSYVYGNSAGLIQSVDADASFGARLTGLEENRQHFVIPQLTTAGGGYIQGNAVYFDTPRLQPLYEKTKVGPDWITLRLLNRDELADAGVELFGISSRFQDNGEPTLYYLQGEQDDIVLPDLKTRTTTGGYRDFPQTQKIGTFIYRDGRESADGVMIVDMPHETMDSEFVRVSLTSVMVRGVCDALFEPRLNILHIGDDTQNEQYADAINTHTQTYYATFRYRPGDIYRVGLERPRNSYSWSNSTIISRIEPDLSEVCGTRLPPYMLLPQIVLSGREPYLKGVYVDGEGDWEYYFEYREPDGADWIKVSPTNQRNVTFQLGDLVEGKVYHVRLTATDGESVISSRTAAVTSAGLVYYLPPTSDEELHAAIVQVAESGLSDVHTVYYGLDGRKVAASKLSPGIYIECRGSKVRKIVI